jgi:hypothetical protein
MDFLRTLKKRRPKKHILARVNVGPPDKPRSGGIRIRKRGTTLNLVSCFAFFLGLAVVTYGEAEDYYFYKGPKGELIINEDRNPDPHERD